MAANKSPQSDTGLKTWQCLALALAGLLVLLLISFHDGLGEGMVHFNNDAPYGMIKAREDSAIAGLTGYWENLNWVGIEQPSGQPELGNAYYFLTGTELFCKTFPAFSLFFLGFCGWVLFRALKFHPVVCFAGAVAAAYNTNSFSNACWGLGTWPIARGMVLLAIAALFSYREKPHWSKLVLAGAAVGFNIMGAFDTGAIYSLYVAAFGLALAFSKASEPLLKRSGKGILQVGVVAVCAFLLSAHTVMNLIGTQVQGVVGMEQTEQAKQERWKGATLWSFPKIETLRLAVPGMFGYRMSESQTAKPADYWGTVGAQDDAPYTRYSGSGEYAGLLVLLLAAWALGQSLRRDGKELSGDNDKYVIWFCAIAGFIALLLSYGRFAPFYQIIYKLPFFSTIRNPIKFTNPLHISLLILFGYGLNNLVKSYFFTSKGETLSWGAAWVAFKKMSDQHAKKLLYGGIVLLGVCGLAGLIYSSSSAELVSYLEKARFTPESAKTLAAYSAKEVFIALMFFAASLLVIWGGMSGWLKPRLALGILVALLAVDFVRANMPWVNFYDYRYRYASNHVIDFLKSQSPYWRNATEVSPLSRSYLLTPEANHFGGVFSAWLQNQYQYYQIQSLDIIQMPRPPVLELNYIMNFKPTDNTTGSDLYKLSRVWELTSTRYLVGLEGYLPILNQQFDRGRNRFSIKEKFQFTAKPGATGNIGQYDVTTAPSDKGPLAIFEFTGALPRAHIYTQWESGMSNSILYTNMGAVTTNEAALPMIAAPDFDPQMKVLISETIPAPASSPAKEGMTNRVSDVNIQSRSVSMKVEVAQDSVLLLNDRHSPNWHVYVDGAERPLLRANYLMRAVQLKPGDKEVIFKFEPTAKYLKITVASMAVALGLLVWWPLREKRQAASPEPAAK
ncbi:MAG TPA: YfhO family protein [Verrucomicrobiae bacterium]